MERRVGQLVTHINLNTDNQTSAINALKALNSISFNAMNTGEPMVVQGHKEVGDDGIKDFPYSEVVGPAITSDSEDENENGNETENDPAQGQRGATVAMRPNESIAIPFPNSPVAVAVAMRQQHLVANEHQQRQNEQNAFFQAMIQQHLNNNGKHHNDSLLQMNLSHHLQMRQPQQEDLFHEGERNHQERDNNITGSAPPQVNDDENDNQKIVEHEHKQEDFHQMHENNELPVIETDPLLEHEQQVEKDQSVNSTER
jgi:hypothetical protein